MLVEEAVDVLRRAVEDDAVLKITGASDKPLALIRRFKNERNPSIAVTVDLLTTGIDVPAICNIVFLRRVRSRILYEQMIGRATRLCPDIKKERFRIFDAVDLYAALAPKSDMRPVVVNPEDLRRRRQLGDQPVRQLEHHPIDDAEVAAPNEIRERRGQLRSGIQRDDHA